jgi:hypothetical protein
MFADEADIRLPFFQWIVTKTRQNQASAVFFLNEAAIMLLF